MKEAEVTPKNTHTKACAHTCTLLPLIASKVTKALSNHRLDPSEIRAESEHQADLSSWKFIFNGPSGLHVQCDRFTVKRRCCCRVDEGVFTGVFPFVITPNTLTLKFNHKNLHFKILCTELQCCNEVAWWRCYARILGIIIYIV